MLFFGLATKHMPTHMPISSKDLCNGQTNGAHENVQDDVKRTDWSWRKIEKSKTINQ
jgi:hypothetical protein